MHSVIVTTLFLLAGAIKSGSNHMSPGFQTYTAHAQFPMKILRMRSNSHFHYGFNFFPKLHRFNSTTSTQFFNAFSFLQKNTSSPGILNCQKVKYQMKFF